MRVPVPDPTALTTEALRRDIGALRELLDQRVDTVYAVLNERDQRYTERGIAVEAAVDKAFASAEKAVAAALEAAEKAILKAEVSIEKRADATYVALGELQRILATLMSRVESDQRFKTIEERHQELTSRVDRIEASKAGMTEGRAGMSDNLKLGISIIGAVVLLIGFFVAQRGGL